MKKKNIISLAGDLAAGKGTVSEILIKELGYDIYRNGEYARKLAKDMGLDITSFNSYLAEHPEIDQQIEKSAAEYAKIHDEFIIDVTGYSKQQITKIRKELESKQTQKSST